MLVVRVNFTALDTTNVARAVALGQLSITYFVLVESAQMWMRTSVYRVGLGKSDKRSRTAHFVITSQLHDKFMTLPLGHVLPRNGQTKYSFSRRRKIMISQISYLGLSRKWICICRCRGLWTWPLQMVQSSRCKTERTLETSQPHIVPKQYTQKNSVHADLLGR